MADKKHGVTVDIQIAKFRLSLMKAIENELVASGKIFRRNLATVLRTTGKSPPASPDGSYIPFNRTGNLARQWNASSRARRTAKGTFTVWVGTNVEYAKWLVVKKSKGRRNYLDGRLSWRRMTLEMMKERLNADRIVKTASRVLRKTQKGME
tara:strand:- start:12183 stop:12638 length:456 start_codon:yes stop_codon:yes gene_type:complete